MRRVPPYMMKPAGWFQIGWSTDFPPGQHCCEAVLRRGGGGVPRRRRDAPCSRRVLRPHGRPSRLWRRGLRRPGGLPVPRLGVERRRSRTSASRTRIDPTGRCAIRSWPVMEQNDIVYLWHHRDGSGPSWTPPDVFEAHGADVAGSDYHAAHPDGQIRFGALDRSTRSSCWTTRPTRHTSRPCTRRRRFPSS